jgi:hypothetical protein
MAAPPESAGGSPGVAFDDRNGEDDRGERPENFQHRTLHSENLCSRGQTMVTLAAAGVNRTKREQTTLIQPTEAGGAGGNKAPKLVIGGAVRDRTAGSTQTRNFRVSRWLRKAILCGQHALGYRRGIGRNGIGFGPGRRARHMPARVLSSWTSPEIRVGFFQPVD